MKKVLILSLLIGLFFSASACASSYVYVVTQGGTGKLKAQEPAYKGQRSGGSYTLVCSDGSVYTTNYRYGRADSASHAIWYIADNGHMNKVCGLRQFN